MALASQPILKFDDPVQDFTASAQTGKPCHSPGSGADNRWSCTSTRRTTRPVARRRRTRSGTKGPRCKTPTWLCWAYAPDENF